MPVEWAGLGPELLVTIDRDSGAGLRSQLEGSAARRDPPRPPGRRRAAAVLARARPPAGAVSRPRPGLLPQLQAEGYLTSRAGSATRVAAAAVPGPTRPPTARPPERARPAVADFRHGVPDLRLAPREDWAWAVREVCRTAPNSAFDYGDPVGEAAAARGARRLPAAGAGGRGHRRAGRRLQRHGAGPRARAARPRRRRHRHHSPSRTPAPAPRQPSRRPPPAWLRCPFPVDADGLDVAALRAHDCSSGPRDPGPPVAHRRRARRAPPAGAHRLGTRTRRCHPRGRLRRRVPLRPRPGRLIARPRPRLRRLARNSQQVARAQLCASAG